MTATVTGRPPKPETPGSGLVYRIVPVEGWRAAEDGATCRWHASAMGITACGEPAVAEKYHPEDIAARKWWAYCAKHLGRNLWEEDGAVLKWVLCHGDGTPANPQEITRARGKRIGTRERPERGPAESVPLSVRVRRDLRDGAEGAADAGRADVSTWVRQAMQARLGYLRCDRCRETAPPVPLELGDLTGRSLDEWLTEAADQVKRQHPRHEPVAVGASATARPAAPGDVPFKSAAAKR